MSQRITGISTHRRGVLAWSAAEVEWAVQESRLIIVCGLPGNGTTTVVRQLAAERNGVRLGPDEWMAALRG